MNEFPTRKVLKPLVVVLALLATSVAVYAAVIDVNRYRSNPGDSFAVTDASGGGCKKVTNNSSNSYFIPTKTAAEYDAFKSATPRLDVSLSGCQIDTYLRNSSGGELPSDPEAVLLNDTCDGDYNKQYMCTPAESRSCQDIYNFVDGWEFLTDTWMWVSATCYL